MMNQPPLTLIPADNKSKATRDLAVLLCAMLFPSVMSLVEFWVLPGSTLAGSDVLKGVFFAGKIAQFGLPLLYVWLTEREQIRWARPDRRGMALAVGLAAVVAAGVFILYFLLLKDTPVLAHTGEKVHHWLSEFHASTPAAFLTMALFIAVFHSFLEEYYWRWFVFGWLQRYLPLPAAIAVSSLAFMSHHVLVLGFYLPGYFWTAAVPFSICVAVGGGVWAWMYHRYGNLYAPWICHLLVDVAIMTVGYDMVSRYW
ncbi:MAG: CPBP family intramembrane metalloprotease [Gemmataceae bacterium]|nr:CPBP family intramembrane metalloprotease [Gemmataceae bacterium]